MDARKEFRKKVQKEKREQEEYELNNMKREMEVWKYITIHK